MIKCPKCGYKETFYNKLISCGKAAILGIIPKKKEFGIACDLPGCCVAAIIEDEGMQVLRPQLIKRKDRRKISRWKW